MTNSKKYNGWYNYETWLINLHYGDGLFYDFIRETTATDVYDASNELRDYFEEYLEDTGYQPDNDFIADVVNTFISEVNWYEIAEYYFDDISNNEEE